MIETTNNMTIVGHGTKWEVTPRGIKQLNPEPFEYDQKYCATYDTEAYTSGEAMLQGSRLGFAIAAHGRPIKSILDFGCGNYAFLKAAQQIIPRCYGYDVADIDPPEGIAKSHSPFGLAEVVTFHDSLEHTDDPASIVSRLRAETVVISLPYCHLRTRGMSWFLNNYPHLKPNEHRWHFDEKMLNNLMSQFGWQHIMTSNHEDAVRKREIDWNILTMAFKRK